MNILINDYKITSDPMNVILNKKVVKKQQDEDQPDEYKPLGYYKNLTSACTALLDREINIGDADNLGELVQLIYDTKKQIIAAVERMESQVKTP